MGSVQDLSIKQADIAIVGGGPAGLSLAGILEQFGISYVIYEKYAKETVPKGGCLDMHAGSGHEAFKQAGVWDEFRKYGRLGEATIHQVWDHKGNKVFAWGEGKDKPELDRSQVKAALLSVIPEQNIKWKTGIDKVERSTNGSIVLHLSNGTTATGFKLVVGADGTWSKVRPLVTTTKPVYAGMTFITGLITHHNSFYPETLLMAGAGPMIVLGRSTKIWNQQQGDGHYRCDLGFVRSEDFLKSSKLDLEDVEAVKQIMLGSDFFGHHASEIQNLIKHLEGPLRAWPLYIMPPDKLNWESATDITLIGDAAHTTTPFVGEGANCAMRDAVVLANHIKNLGIGKEAILAYEEDMKPYAADIITRSVLSGELFFDFNAPRTFMEGMQKRPLIKDM